MPKKTKKPKAVVKQPYTVPSECSGNCANNCLYHNKIKIKNTKCVCCQSCKTYRKGGGAPGGHQFKKSKRKASKRKASKRKL